MKAHLRIATKDAYCYIEAECEGTPEQIVEQYGEIYSAYHDRNGKGLPEKEFNAILDGYVWNGKPLEPDQNANLSKEQNFLIQAIKRSKKRELYKARKSTDENDTHINNINTHK